LAFALEAISASQAAVQLDIFGPIEDQAYWELCQRLMAGMPARATARYMGELPHAQVSSTVGAYDAFLFPTLGENFGHVIAESLASGCPVICSKTTPWSPVLRDGGGAVVDTISPAAWAAEIRKWASFGVVEKRKKKDAAHDAYERWRAEQEGVNVLNVLATSTNRSDFPSSRRTA
jgi:glycosyltransferase involved in cell wall biosynthesis